MTIEKTKEESTIITSSSVSILPAAVDPCSPFQSGISMITEVMAVRTSTAAISLGIGTPRMRAAFYSGPLTNRATGRGLCSGDDRRQFLQLTARGGDHPAGDALPAPEPIDALGERPASRSPTVRGELEPPTDAVAELRDRARPDGKAEQP